MEFSDDNLIKLPFLLCVFFIGAIFGGNIQVFVFGMTLSLVGFLLGGLGCVFGYLLSAHFRSSNEE